MTTELMLGPGQGNRILGGGLNFTVKATMGGGGFAATFECVVPPGYDVGAHVHTEGIEMFYVVSGELAIVAFEPLDRTDKNWRDWRSASGDRYLRGGPGAFMLVPPGTPHAFANLSEEPTTMYFQSSMAAGHEEYFRELAAILEASGDGPPDDAAIIDLRHHYDIEQLTPMRPSGTH